ncbi:MAG: AraC family transcriptional regulator [Chitinophagaceae bacterium]|nr:MAG: AraC family transcriptional regulator [Chitinophagaceae bacterium]
MTEFLYLLVILGSLQGIIMGSLLYTQRNASLPARILAMIIWVTALPGIHLFLHYKNVFEVSGITAVLHASIPWVSVMALGPLLLFYVRSVTNPSFRVNGKQLVWLIPAMIDIFPKLVELAYLGSVIPSSLHVTGTDTVNFANLYNRYADLPRWLMLAVCIFQAAHELKIYREQVVMAMQQQAKLFRWLRQFIRVFRYFMLLWLLFLIPYLTPAYSRMLQTVGWFPVYLPMAVLIYWLGIRGYQSGRPAKHSDEQEQPAPPTRTAVDDEGKLQLIKLLDSCMRERKLYLDPTLDLAAFSLAAGNPSRMISAALNQHLGKTFNQYVNEYRVEEFIRGSVLLRDLSIAGLAAKCGFTSLPTFQRVFKQVTGLSPTEYLRRNAS